MPYIVGTCRPMRAFVPSGTQCRASSALAPADASRQERAGPMDKGGPGGEAGAGSSHRLTCSAGPLSSSWAKPAAVHFGRVGKSPPGDKSPWALPLEKGSSWAGLLFSGRTGAKWRSEVGSGR
jgi:hypothetical protein